MRWYGCLVCWVNGRTVGLCVLVGTFIAGSAEAGLRISTSGAKAGPTAGIELLALEKRIDAGAWAHVRKGQGNAAG